MAQDPGAHLDRLPDELLLGIIEQSSGRGKWQYEVLSPRDLISLACTSRRHYRIAISTAYKRHVKEENGLAIYWAIENEEYGTLKRLVENGVDVNMRDEHNYGTPIEVDKWFWIHGLEKTAAFIKTDLNARFSPLAWAASHGHDPMVEYLLDHGADMEQLSEKLCSCCNSKLLRCPRFLPDPLKFYKGPRDLVSDRDLVSEWWKPLHYALCNGNESTVQLLIERGADANKVGFYTGVTALHIATRWELDATIDYLLNRNCVDLNAQDFEGATALHMAQVAGRDDLVDDYLDRGADINLEFSDPLVSGPWTIFGMACAAGDYERALELLKRGADPHFVLKDQFQDDDSWTVMRLIYWSGGDTYEYPLYKADERMALEREIIARGNGSSTDT